VRINIRHALVGLFACCLVPCTLLLLAPWLDRPAIPLAGPVDAIVVLGGEHPSRIRAGVKLYQAGVSRRIWITGDVPPPGQEVSLAEAARWVAFQRGVRMRHQRLLATTSTAEDAREIAAAARESGAGRLLIVTSWYHSRRAVCLIQRELAGSGVELGYLPAASTWAPRDRWWGQRSGWFTLGRESLATGYYWARFGLSPWQC
jgi:uncharacterized SAM-binding protein YcdF (DUF218 family)